MGLAAPQIGWDAQVFAFIVMGIPVPIFNPVIEWHGKKPTWSEEGCLSLPGQRVVVPRWKEIRVRYRDINWKDSWKQLDGEVAIVWQHEIEHLKGTLIIDYEGLYEQRNNPDTTVSKKT